jgi:YVTN family beta-propeller protein
MPPPMRARRPLVLPTALLALVAALGACGSGTPVARPRAPAPSPRPASSTPGEPNVYAATLATRPIPRLAGLQPLVYVPNSKAGTVDVFDPLTRRHVDRFPVGAVPHHVFPSFDMTRLYVGNTASNTLTEVDIRTHRPVRTIPVPDPYNLYWPWVGGVRAMVIAERLRRIDFRDPESFRLLGSVAIPWAGIDHGDFTADGRHWIGSTEYAGVVVKVDVVGMTLAGQVRVGGLPVDVRLSPDGRRLFVANQGLHGVSVLDPDTLRVLAFIPTGRGAHGLQLSKDLTRLYVSNRRAGSISVIDLGSSRVVATWRVGGSPDMMQLSWDGSELWVSNRFHASVSVVDTASGRVLAVLPAGAEAHGLTYFPGVGERCIGHNGVYR